jgi:hypothetical protein
MDELSEEDLGRHLDEALRLALEGNLSNLNMGASIYLAFCKYLSHRMKKSTHSQTGCDRDFEKASSSQIGQSYDRYIVFFKN